MAWQQLNFYCAWFSPSGQRAWIALAHKGVDFEYIEQDPYDKNPEWLAINPRGLVPAIVYNGKSVYESPVCIEYVDELWPNTNSLLPRDPYDRAMVRIWCDHITKKIVPPFYAMLLKENHAERDQCKTELIKQTLQITNAMSKDGPYFRGKDFGMVDIMLFPHALRFDHILKEYRGFEIPKDSQFKRFHEWFDAVAQLDSVKATIQPRQKLVDKYKRYAENTAQTEVAEAIRKGQTLP